MGIEQAFWVLLVFIMLGFIWQHMKVGQTAFAAARKRCEQAQVNFLDESVVLKNLYPKVGKPAGLLIVRRYGFEFSTLGDVRYAGLVTLHGHRVHAVELSPFKTQEPGEI